MPLPIPKLDDRTFQNLVDEAKKRIPHYTKEWTDHNVSDPGVTLIELFAWMTDVLLFRLNQVPDLHYIKFMEMLGITLQEPFPAEAWVSFWLSQPQTIPVIISEGTEVATTQTENEPSIIFTTSSDLTIMPPKLGVAIQRITSSDGQNKSYKEFNIRRLEAGFEGADAFSGVPQVDDALYFGFDNDLSHHILGFDFDFDPAGGAGIDPTLPPYAIEASTGDDKRWKTCEIEIDTTKGMNTSVRIQVHLPKMGKYKIEKDDKYWVRIKIKEISSTEARMGMRSYDRSPRLRKAVIASWGGAVQAFHAQVVNREYLGQSDGTPGQRFLLQRKPILKREKGENVAIQVDDKPLMTWKEVQNFSSSGAHELHYTLDSASGEIRFGPAIRQPDGTMKLFGAIPPRGATIFLQRYRYGGGGTGNVSAGVLNTLKTAIPFVARVANRQAAWGGMDPETLESAMMRAPSLLRSRDRAVTESDYEFLARQALPESIGRVRCLQPKPGAGSAVVAGQVYLLVIPRLPNPAGFLAPKSLELSQEATSTLTTYMDERRLLTTRLDIRPPAYNWVAVRVQLRAAPGGNKTAVENAVLSRLNKFLNPLTGGSEGRGWEFGRPLFISDVYQSLQGLADIQFIRGVEMYSAQPGGSPQGNPVETIEVLAHAVIASGVHEVKFI